MSDTDAKSPEPDDPKPGIDVSANLDDDLIDPDKMDGYGTQAPGRRGGTGSQPGPRRRQGFAIWRGAHA